MQSNASVPQSSEVAIFGRLIRSNEGNLSRALARYFLTLDFHPADQTRMQDLAARNQAGALSATEKEELQSYVKAGHLLALLHSKARKSLSKQKAS